MKDVVKGVVKDVQDVVEEAAPGLWTRYGLVAKALLAAFVLVGIKAAVAWSGLEFVSTLSLLTGLMGAVVFTLAILLSGVLSDFKESERLVTEMATELERLDRDLPLALKDPDALARGRRHVRDLVGKLHETLRRGTSVRMRELRAPIEAIDADLDAAAFAGGPPNYVLFARAHVAAVSKMVYRVEGIIETTFVQSAYAIAATVVAVALAVFAVTDIDPLPQGLLLYGFGAFLLTGLFLLIEDLDNPFSGHARVDLRPLARLEARLAAETKAPAPVTVVAVQ